VSAPRNGRLAGKTPTSPSQSSSSATRAAIAALSALPSPAGSAKVS
jgi:hypothetical protein